MLFLLRLGYLKNATAIYGSELFRNSFRYPIFSLLCDSIQEYFSDKIHLTLWPSGAPVNEVPKGTHRRFRAKLKINNCRNVSRKFIPERDAPQSPPHVSEAKVFRGDMCLAGQNQLSILFQLSKVVLLDGGQLTNDSNVGLNWG